MESVKVPTRNTDKENDSKAINESKPLPRIGSKPNIFSDDEIYTEDINYKYSNLKINSFPSKSKAFPHNHHHPYSAASTKSLLGRSKTRLARSNSNRHNQNRPHTTTKYNRYHQPQQPKYANWGMKIDSTEALRDQILRLKKNMKTVCDENKLIKTEKRRMEKLLHKNDRKLKRLLNTVSHKKSLIGGPNMNNHNVANFLGDENRKFASTELLDMLNVSHNTNISLKRRLEKTKQELETSQNIINHLQSKSNQMQYEEYNLDDEESSENQAIIEHLENQLSEYKSEISECHNVFDKLTKSNDDALNKLDEKDKENINFKQENIQLNKELKELKNIIQNEKFFNNKVLDEITDFKKKNQDLENDLKQQKQIETENKSQIKKLSNKLSDIEIELKERIEFYQIFEKSCTQCNKFINELIIKAQENQNNENNNKITSLCNNLKIWFQNLQNPQNNFDQNINNATHFLQELFVDSKNNKTQIISDDKTPKKQHENVEAPEASHKEIIEEKQNENLEIIAVKTQKQQKENTEIVVFKSPEDTHKEIIENTNIHKSVTLSEVISSRVDDESSSMSLYDAVVEICTRSREQSETINCNKNN